MRCGLSCRSHRVRGLGNLNIVNSELDNLLFSPSWNQNASKKYLVRAAYLRRRHTFLGCLRGSRQRTGIASGHGAMRVPLGGIADLNGKRLRQPAVARRQKDMLASFCARNEASLSIRQQIKTWLFL